MLTRKQIWRKIGFSKYEDNSACKTKTKKVEFNPRVSVILIPTVEDYIKSNLKSDLWYNSMDYINFNQTEDSINCNLM